MNGTKGVVEPPYLTASRHLSGTAKLNLMLSWRPKAAIRFLWIWILKMGFYQVASENRTSTDICGGTTYMLSNDE